MTVQPVFFAIASDESASQAYSTQRLLNLYPEPSPTKGKSRYVLLGRPGLKPFTTANSGDVFVRGSHVMAGVLYVVVGNSLYSIGSGGTATLIGSGGEIGGDSLCIMADNGFQLAIATDNAWVDVIDGYFLWGRNVDGTAYLYDSDLATFGEISDTDLFLSGTGKWQISALNDGSSYDPLDFATAESTPTPLIRGFVDRADIFLCKEDVIEVWFNSGAADFPFERRNQTVIPKGIMGRDVICSADNSVFFVGRDGQAGGSAIVYRLNGFEPLRVSTHAVETALSSITDWSNCRVISYIINGHVFVAVILFDDVTWVYDCATGLWHEDDTHDLGRWQGNSHSYCYNKHLIGSSNSNDIFELDTAYYFDGSGTQIDREAISAPVGDDSSHKTMGMFQLDMETGRGLSSGTGSQPVVTFSYSDDRGETFGNTRTRSAGAIGEYGIRVIWRQLGRFKTRVLKIQITDPIKVAILDYFVDIVAAGG